MPDIKTKKITDLQEKTVISDNDLIAVGNAGTASLRKTKWSTFWNNILTKIRGTIIVNNKVTTEEGYALDARMGKDFQKQLDDLNTKIDSKANSPSYGDYGCFFIALNSKVYLFIPLATVHSKTFTLKEIAVAGGGHMGTQNTFNLAWKLMNGLLFESTDSNVVFLFKDTYKGHAILGTASLDIV